MDFGPFLESTGQIRNVVFVTLIYCVTQFNSAGKTRKFIVIDGPFKAQIFGKKLNFGFQRERDRKEETCRSLGYHCASNSGRKEFKINNPVKVESVFFKIYVLRRFTGT